MTIFADAVCDRCQVSANDQNPPRGDDLTQHMPYHLGGVNITYRPGHLEPNRGPVSRNGHEIDLCADCWEELKSWLANTHSIRSNAIIEAAKRPEVGDQINVADLQGIFDVTSVQLEEGTWMVRFTRNELDRKYWPDVVTADNGKTRMSSVTPARVCVECRDQTKVCECDGPPNDRGLDSYD